MRQSVNSYSIFLDDQRFPSEVKWIDLPLVEWTIVRNYDQFVKCILEKGVPLRVSWDHDLCEDHMKFVTDHYPFMEADGGVGSPKVIPYDSYTEKTGYHCAEWLLKYCVEKNLPFPEYFVHSFNPVGRENIKKLIGGYKNHYKNL